MGATGARKQVNSSEYDVGDEDALYESCSPSSARRYIQPVERDTLDDPLLQRNTFIQRRRSSITSNSSNAAAKGTASKPLTKPVTQARKSIKRFPVVAVLLGMVVMALLAMALSAFGSWWRIHQDDMQYGRPRTFQMDAVVGHEDSPSNPTHFIFLNLNRHIEIIELPGADAAHARIYPGPILFGNGQDLTPVTAEVRDVNGDGKPDIIVHILDQQFILINDGMQFRPQPPGGTSS